MDKQARTKKVLIIVENEPVPFDRRVWEESLALVDGGYQVTVICPNPRKQPSYELLQGVTVYRYPPPPEGDSIWGYLKEYFYSLFVIFRYSLKARAREGFDVIHACGPPDMLFLVGLFHKLFGGKKFIFDHHDISPELYALRYDPKKRSFVFKLLMWLERCAFNTASVVLSTNESYRSLAISRGHKKPESVFVVRNGPNLALFKPGSPVPELKHGRDYMVCYVGVMADQDGLDCLLESASHVINVRGRKDITFCLVGGGDAVESLKKLASELGIADNVVFTGRVSDADLISYLSTADVCVGPDPENDFNDKCTFVKIAEYMAMGKPVVSFNLTEQKFTAQEAALYVEGNDTAEFGNKIIELIDDPARRAKMGEFGMRRVVDALSWDHGRASLLKAYGVVFGGLKKRDGAS